MEVDNNIAIVITCNIVRKGWHDLGTGVLVFGFPIYFFYEMSEETRTQIGGQGQAEQKEGEISKVTPRSRVTIEEAKRTC